MKINKILYLFLALFFSVTTILYGQDDSVDPFDLDLEDLFEIAVISAAKYKQTTGEAPSAVTVITAEEIERYGYQTLEDVFDAMRGFYTSNDRNYVYLGVRGFSRPTDYNNRILLLINGHSTNETIWGSAAIGPSLGIELGMIERIEIVRGPGSALYGTYAMFAVINLITKDGNSIDGIQLSAGTGSFGRLQGSVRLGQEFDNGLKISILGQWTDIKGEDLYYEEYDDPATNNGIAEDLDEDEYYGLITTIDYKNFKLQGKFSSRDTKIPTAPYETAFNGDCNNVDKLAFVELTYDHRINDGMKIVFRNYLDYYDYIGTYPYENEYYEGCKIYWLGTELQFHWALSAKHRLVMGSEYQNHFKAHYHTWDEEETYFDEDFPSHLYSFYLQDTYQAIENLSFTLGIRRDEYSSFGSSLTPRAALLYNPFESGTLKLLFGKAFRGPSAYEMNYDEEGLQQSNPDLDPEKIRTFEIIWEQRLSESLFGTLSLYHYQMEDLINEVELPSEESQFQNINKVDAQGLELELDARLKNGLWSYLNYTFQDTKDPDLDEKLTNSPSHLLKAGLSAPLLKYFYASAEMRYETERKTVQESETDAYFITNLNLSTKLLFDHINCSLRIKNLFDADYKKPGGYEHEQPAIAQDGRNFILKMDYKF